MKEGDRRRMVGEGSKGKGCTGFYSQGGRGFQGRSGLGVQDAAPCGGISEGACGCAPVHVRACAVCSGAGGWQGWLPGLG